MSTTFWGFQPGRYCEPTAQDVELLPEAIEHMLAEEPYVRDRSTVMYAHYGLLSTAVSRTVILDTEGATRSEEFEVHVETPHAEPELRGSAGVLLQGCETPVLLSLNGTYYQGSEADVAARGVLDFALGVARAQTGGVWSDSVLNARLEALHDNLVGVLVSNRSDVSGLADHKASLVTEPQHAPGQFEAILSDPSFRQEVERRERWSFDNNQYLILPKDGALRASYEARQRLQWGRVVRLASNHVIQHGHVDAESEDFVPTSMLELHTGVFNPIINHISTDGKISRDWASMEDVLRFRRYLRGHIKELVESSE